ncbi:MAG: GMC family oxidoreductase N-terminal domain-containing protein, partial [Deltaproteobacteria bacterium]|nr:GMC family oxidoreductase N-terminal domain-containing protein [Deltaproteobacteria bacterium]
NPYHGNDGELNVTHVEMKYPISEAYMDAAESIGIRRLDDINGETQRGIGYMQVTMKNRQRWSSADAFLSPGVRARPNLTITLNAAAKRVLLDGKQAVGVEYEDAKGRVHQVEAKREVVLSAGAYNSPPLLETSGIGRRDVLAALGVEVLHELQGVGENLQDHLQLWVQHGVKTKKTISEDGKFPRIVLNVLRYLFTKTGPLTFPAANVGAFVSSDTGGRPIFQLHFTPHIPRQRPCAEPKPQRRAQDRAQLPVDRARPRAQHRRLQAPAAHLRCGAVPRTRNRRDPAR